MIRCRLSSVKCGMSSKTRSGDPPAFTWREEDRSSFPPSRLKPAERSSTYCNWHSRLSSCHRERVDQSSHYYVCRTQSKASPDSARSRRGESPGRTWVQCSFVAVLPSLWSPCGVGGYCVGPTS